MLFQGTVFENVRYGLVGTEWERNTHHQQMERVQEACKIAFAHDFISDLPNGYDTEIGQRGGLLSGGQRQRIAIARSIVSKPKILLLDEATSALDPSAEGIVQRALDMASEGRTTIVIAHKLATIQKADNIVVMAKGRILEKGSHASLMAKDQAYARLVKVQNLHVQSNNSEEETPRATNINVESLDLIRKTTRETTSVTDQMIARRERDNYDHHKQRGILYVIYRLIRMTPELSVAYTFVFAGCVLAGKRSHRAILVSYC